MRCASLLLAVALAACTATSDPTELGSGGSGGAGGGTSTSGAGGMASSSGAGGFDPTSSGGSTGTGGDPADAEVFAESPTTLYKLDPITKGITTVGNFSGCSDVIDIALDKDGNIYGTTFGSLYKIDKKTAACTHVADGSFPNSLSFVPEGTLDPSVEALVGFVDATYVRIDPMTGGVTNIGSIGGGYSSSGDVVSVKGGKTYLTVTGNSCGDCLLEIDPKTGAVVTNLGAIQHGAVFGLAFWGGKAYGFDNAELFEIDLATFATTTIPMPNPPPDLIFWGAGSSTHAPLVPPPS